eukprot:9484573-Pyramimonas_sp.AAC.1
MRRGGRSRSTAGVRHILSNVIWDISYQIWTWFQIEWVARAYWQMIPIDRSLSFIICTLTNHDLASLRSS